MKTGSNDKAKKTTNPGLRVVFIVNWGGLPLDVSFWVFEARVIGNMAKTKDHKRGPERATLPEISHRGFEREGSDHARNGLRHLISKKERS